MRASTIATLCLAFIVGCSQSADEKYNAMAAKTIVEIRGMSYPQVAEGERERPPTTYVNTNPDDIKRFEQWLRSHRGNWQQESGPPPNRRPDATCSLIYGNGKPLDFAIDDHALISGDQKLPLSDADFQFVRQICLKSR